MLEREDVIALYRTMTRIRLFEEKVAELLEEGKIYGPAHLYIGEEAIAAGVCHYLNEDDYITSTHRGHGHLIAKGGRCDRMMAELFARCDGYCKGKGGSMHIADMSLGILGANGITGAGVPLALGAAFSSQYLRNGRICVSFFGDGSSNQGLCLESLNIAAVYRLPVIFVCENNGYSVGTRWERVSVSDVASRAMGFGVQAVKLDGQDVEGVAEAAREAIVRAREGDGPTLLECMTYRQKGHCGLWDDARPPAEVAAWQCRDPLVLLADKIGDRFPEDFALLDQLRNDAREEMMSAVTFAANNPLPDPAEALTDIYGSTAGTAFVQAGAAVQLSEDTASKYWENE